MARGRVEVLLDYCKGCGLCVSVCPTGSLAMSEELGPLGVNPACPVAEAECTLCRRCATICPDAAIRLIRLEDADRAPDRRAAAVSGSRERDDE